jgi:glycosyltransferase involved in cell wall biosynthesis
MDGMNEQLRMRILFDISPAVHRHAGLGRYAFELLRALLHFDRDNDYHAFYNHVGAGEHVEPPLDRLPAHSLGLPAKPWRICVLLAQLSHTGMDRWLPACDVFHATEHLLPPLKRAGSVFTVHDLIFLHFPEYHLPINRWYLTLMLPRFLLGADALIAVSENTKRDVVELMHIPPEKISVIYEGVSPAFRPFENSAERERVREKYKLPNRYLLSLGTIEPRKNLVTLLDAYHLLLARGQTVPHLVLAGRKGWLFGPVLARVRELGLDERVHFTGWIDEQDAPAIMSAAAAFVYPSLYEGFGLPPLEAMACGTPVICSNASSLPEVVGDGGLLVEPRDVGALADAIARVLGDEGLRAQLRMRGLAQAQRFSWEQTARETMAVYQSVAAKRVPRRNS